MQRKGSSSMTKFIKGQLVKIKLSDEIAIITNVLPVPCNPIQIEMTQKYDVTVLESMDENHIGDDLCFSEMNLEAYYFTVEVKGKVSFKPEKGMVVKSKEFTNKFIVTKVEPNCFYGTRGIGYGSEKLSINGYEKANSESQIFARFK